MSPLVSVYITNFNYGKYLPQSINSVLSQTSDNWELIIIDDGSSDNSYDILAQFDSHPKIKIVYNQNQGLIKSANMALKLSTGKYIVRLDADDYFDENALLILSNTLETKQDIGMVYPDYYHVDKNGEILDLVHRKKIEMEVGLLDLPAHGAGTMFKKSCFAELGGYNPELTCQDGYDIWLKFINTYKIYNVNLPLFYYRRHGKNLTTNSQKILTTRRYIKRRHVEKHFGHQSLNVLGIIPTKGDGHSIKNFPLKSLAGKPVIYYTIEEAEKCEQINRLIFTTESQTVADAAKKSGVEVVIRPEELADSSQGFEKTVMFILDYLAKQNYFADIVVLMSITSPLKKSYHITEAIDTLLIFDCDSVISVCEDLKFHYRHDFYGLTPLFKKRLLRMEKESLYEENGALFVSKRNVISDESFLGKTISHIIMQKEESIDIDEQFDFWMSEQIIKQYQP